MVHDQARKNQFSTTIAASILAVLCAIALFGCDGSSGTASDPYAEQKTLLEERLMSDSVAGFKAGLTSAASQAAFHTDAPLAGVLLAGGSQPNQAFIHASDFGQLMIELEIGFIAGKPITSKVDSVEELRKMISAAAPAIELPDLALLGGDTSVPSLIRNNVGSHSYIIGSSRGASEDVNAVEARLYRDDVEVNSGTGSDAMGDQWEALLWLVNRTIESGWTIKPGEVMISGALGAMVPGEPGRYRADFGEFGEINFSVL